MSSVPASSSVSLWSSATHVWSNTILPPLKILGFTQSSYKSIAESQVFNWSSKQEDPNTIRKQKALTLLFAACIGFCASKAYTAVDKYLESQNVRGKFVVNILIVLSISRIAGEISSNIIPLCQKIQTTVESNYPLFGWETPNRDDNFLPFPFNLTTRWA